MILWLVALAGLAFYFAQTLYLSLLALGYPFQLDYGEGLVLYQSQHIAQGLSIYKDINSYPFIFSNYPPLFQTLVSPFVAVMGPSFFPGRLLAIAAALVLGIVAFVLARRCGGSRLGAGVAALLFLGSPYIYHWAPLFRIDLPALLLTALGMLVMASVTTSITPEKTIEGGRRSPGDPSLSANTRRVYLAGLLFCLSAFTKQSYLVAPATALVYLLVANRRLARHLAASLIVFGVLPFMALEVATAGAFSLDLITANVNLFSGQLLVSQVSHFALTFSVIILLAAVGVAGQWRQATPGTVGQGGSIGSAPAVRAAAPILLWYLIASLTTVLLAGKVGAWENYFFEPLFMLCVFAGVGLDRLAASPRFILQLGAPALLIVQLALMWRDPSLPAQIVRDDGAANRALAPLIAGQSGMILSEDAGLLLVNGKDVPFFAFQYAQLAHQGLWDQRWVVENLERGKFGLVVLEKGTREDPDHYQRFTRRMLSAMDTGYGLVAEVGKYRIYSPQAVISTTNEVFGDVIALRGYRLDAEAHPADEGFYIPPPDAGAPDLNQRPSVLRVTLLWQALAEIPKDYKVFVHLTDSNGRLVAQDDSMPFANLYPTSRWQVDEVVRDAHDVQLPPDLPAGRYTVSVGLYDPQTGQRLALPNGDSSLTIASLPVAAP